MEFFIDIPQREWERIKAENEWNELELRDDRYCQVIHMVSAANGAEAFYTTSDHKTRSESLEIARELDNTTANVSHLHLFINLFELLVI